MYTMAKCPSSLKISALFMVLALVFVATVSARVPSDSYHKEDAILFDEAILYYSGVDEPVLCKITPIEDQGMCYMAVFPGPYEGEGRLSAAIIAAGVVSSSTTWSSTYVGIGFDGGDGV